MQSQNSYYRWGFCDKCARLGRQCKLVDGKCTTLMDDTKEFDNKVQLASRVRIDAYKIIDDAVESGVRYGFSRAHKHADSPSKEHVIEEIHRQVMNSLCEILKFDEES